VEKEVESVKKELAPEDQNLLADLLIPVNNTIPLPVQEETANVISTQGMTNSLDNQLKLFKAPVFSSVIAEQFKVVASAGKERN
jgi:hypothetical protein